MSQCQRNCNPCLKENIGRVEEIFQNEVEVVKVIFDLSPMEILKEEIQFGENIKIGDWVCVDKEFNFKCCKFFIIHQDIEEWEKNLQEIIK